MRTIGLGYTGDEVATRSPLNQNVFSDFNFYFTPSPAFTEKGLSGDIPLVVDNKSIQQSVRTIVLTNAYEKPFNEGFGASIRRYLFEQIDAWERYKMIDAIETQLELYEPRINVNEVKIKENPSLNSMFVTVDYTIKAVERKETTEVRISAERIR